MPGLDTGAEAPCRSARSTGSTDTGEMALIRRLAEYPRIIEAAAEAHEPHRIAFYLHDLASELHGHWNRGKELPQLRFINPADSDSTLARLALVHATKLVLSVGIGYSWRECARGNALSGVGAFAAVVRRDEFLSAGIGRWPIATTRNSRCGRQANGSRPKPQRGLARSAGRTRPHRLGHGRLSTPAPAGKRKTVPRPRRCRRTADLGARSRGRTPERSAGVVSRFAKPLAPAACAACAAPSAAPPRHLAPPRGAAACCRPKPPPRVSAAG